MKFLIFCILLRIENVNCYTKIANEVSRTNLPFTNDEKTDILKRIKKLEQENYTHKREIQRLRKSSKFSK
jgi:hypothetical protein